MVDKCCWCWWGIQASWWENAWRVLFDFNLNFTETKFGKTGDDPVTNAKNVVNVASLDYKTYCSKYLYLFTNSVSSYSIGCITVWASKLLFNKNRLRKISVSDFIAFLNPNIFRPELKWSNNGFIIMSCKSKCWIILPRFPF